MAEPIARLTTAEAAARLGVKPETLYAYVSRGLIDRERGPDGSTFSARDVDRLALAGRRVRSLPAMVFPSALTLIEDDRVYYRGLDATELSRTRTFEEVASWLWRGTWPSSSQPWAEDAGALQAVLAAQSPLPDTALPLDRFHVVVAVAAGIDPIRHDTTADVTIATTQRLLRLMARSLPTASGKAPPRAEPNQPLAEVLWRRLSPLPVTPGRVAALDAALVLLADHELATSTLAARSAAMVRADAYEVVGAGLNVVGGTRHGGASLDLEGVLRNAEVAGAGRAVDARLAQGHLPGFGHSIYKHGDPRTQPLFDRLDALDPEPHRRKLVEDVLRAAASRHVPEPNVDAGIAALAWCSQMRPGSGEAIFGISRTAGWIAHALEQYDQPTFMRARVDYTGHRP